MLIKRQRYLISIISLLILISSLYASNYALSRVNNRSEVEYGLSSNVIKLVRNTNQEVKFSEIVSLDIDNITILTTSNFKEVAIYDPAMYFYLHSDRITDITFRYFSKEDYLKKSNYGMLVFDEFSQDIKPTSEELNLDEIIYSFLPRIGIYDNGTEVIRNLAYTDKFEDIIFLDSIDKNMIHIIADQLVNRGYSIETNKKISLFDSIFISLSGSLYNRYVLINMFIIYAIFFISLIVYFNSQDRTFKVHYLYGGEQSTIFKRLIFNFIMINTIVNLMSLPIFYLIKQLSFFNLFTMLEYSSILIIHLLITTSSYYLAYFISSQLFLKRGVENEKRY